jgi:RimJ/RimL family protein N-acetyltransferase
LRPFRFGDVADVLAYAQDEQWAAFLPMVPQPYRERDAEQYIAQAILSFWETDAQLAIVVDGRVIGAVRVGTDVANQRAELGYAIARRYWGEGLVPEAAGAVVEWVFRASSVMKIIARADARNQQSIRVMRKLGMRQEALLHSEGFGRHGERVDEVIYVLLREERERTKDVAISPTIEATPDPADVQMVWDGLTAYNESQVGDDGHQRLTLFLRSPEGTIVGGLLGDTYWGWVHVSALWIADAFRHQGYGRSLLAAAEQEAVRRGCHHAHLDTMSFQALSFYEQQGYTVFGQLDAMPSGHSRYFLRKALV